MARVALASFKNKDVRRVFIASSVREAERTEELLISEGVDYAVEPELFSRKVAGVWPTEAAGAVFYVLSGPSFVLP